jgi:simple sugar transport system ATP-binding protein
LANSRAGVATRAVLVVEGLCKSFGKLKAVDSVSFSLRPGEVLGVLGENGAGKTTLMRMIAGLTRPDEGHVSVEGRRVEQKGPEASLAAGIGMIHQHFMLIPRLKVWENVVLGAEPRGRFGRLGQEQAVRSVRELAERYGMQVDPLDEVASLSVGGRQRVEIMKAFYRGARILILDEPTALLAPQEVADLFSTIRSLGESGISTIFISHKLDEVLAICQRVLVLRHGKATGELEVGPSTSASDLAELMVGGQVPPPTPRSKRAPDEVAVRADGLVRPAGKGLLGLGPMSFTVRKGEILGIAGIEGNGQEELAEALVGVLGRTRGVIELGGVRVDGAGAPYRYGHGLAYIPADRQRDALVMGMTAWENFVLRDLSRTFRKGLGVDVERARRATAEAMSRFDVRPREPNLLVSSFSGGNQQKLVLARELSRRPRFLVACQPTRGLDIAATQFVRGELVAARNAGAAIVLISSDLDEVLDLSDRVAVMFRGRLTPTAPAAGLSPQAIGLAMLGHGGLGPDPIGAEVTEAAR